MTKFDKTKFVSGEYVTYEGRFVARFKRGALKGGRATFLTFLVKNFTVEEYFQKLEVENVPPLKILEAKGYLLPHIKKWLKEAGLPLTPEGFQMLVESNIASRLVKGV